MAEIIKQVHGAITSAHIHRHMLVCQLICAFKYIMYSGEMYSELTPQAKPRAVETQLPSRQWVWQLDLST